jgi:hypothetical protein
MSINEAGGYVYEAMTPSSINEPTVYPPPTPPPVIASIAPATAVIGGADVILAVTGTGFFATSAIFFDGQKKTTTLGGDGKLTARIKPVNYAAPATVQVQVRNGAAPSNLKSFVFTATAEE